MHLQLLNKELEMANAQRKKIQLTIVIKAKKVNEVVKAL